MTINIDLAPLDSSDMGLVRKWRNNPAIWQWCRQNTLISDAQQVRWFNAQDADPSIKMFKILLTNGEKTAPIGVCGLTSIDHLNRRAEFSLYIAPEAQGKGLGRAALTLLLRHGFYDFGLNLIWGESYEGNPALRTFGAIGFRNDGIRRQFYFRGGRYINAILVSITREEFDAEYNSDNYSRSVGVQHDANRDSNDLHSPASEVPESGKAPEAAPAESQPEAEKADQEKAHC